MPGIGCELINSNLLRHSQRFLINSCQIGRGSLRSKKVRLRGAINNNLSINVPKRSHLLTIFPHFIIYEEYWDFLLNHIVNSSLQ